MFQGFALLQEECWSYFYPTGQRIRQAHYVTLYNFRTYVPLIEMCMN